MQEQGTKRDTHELEGLPTREPTQPDHSIHRDLGEERTPTPASGRGYGFSASLTNDRLHLMDYVRILHKRRWTAITAFVLVFGSATLYTFTATPLFDAKAQILIENQEQKVVQFEQVLDENRATNDYYQTQYRILQSRTLARRTMDSEKLWDHPFFVREEASLLGRLFKRDGASGGSAESVETTNETAAQSIAIDNFLRSLAVTPVRNSRLVEVRYRSPDPTLSARVVNALSKQYIEQNLEFKFLASKEATEFLSARMAEQRKFLEQSEQALQKYREQTGAVALADRQNIVVQRLTDLNAAVTKARTERIEKEAVYNQIRSVEADRAALDTVPAILTNTFIQQLKAQQSDLQRQRAQLGEKLGERHPEMVKLRTAIESTESRLGAEVQKVVQALRRDYEAALSNEKALMTSLEQQRSEAQELNRASIQYGVLERDTTTNRQMFDSLLQRAKETDISGELKTSSIRVVDAAEAPRRQASPNLRNNLAIGFLGGLLLGVTLAFFFEYLDSRLKTPEEIKTQLGLPYLGLIPAIDVKKLVGAPLVNNGVPAHFSEAFRTIRTNVLFSSAEEGPKSVVVTSTVPSEGKTVVAANLAISLAAAGQRVLLIDADMRRPKVHELFGRSLEPGLSNVLVGDGKASEAVKKTGVSNMWVLAAGKHPPNPAELLGSKRFVEFLSSLGQHFDWVIVDTPPVMAVSDAAVVGHVATGVVFVVAADMTTKGAARSALDQLDVAKAHYIGAVLNKVDLRKNSYYYAAYYRKDNDRYYLGNEGSGRVRSSA
jgi:succinoglycan biosynthesis transport protein ExoP